MWTYRGFWGLGWSNGRKLEGENYGFDVGASKLFNNSTTSPTLQPPFWRNLYLFSVSFLVSSVFDPLDFSSQDILFLKNSLWLLRPKNFNNLWRDLEFIPPFIWFFPFHLPLFLKFFQKLLEPIDHFGLHLAYFN